MNLSMEASSLKKGETLIDTALTLNAMKPDLLIVRHLNLVQWIYLHKRLTALS